MIERRTIRFDAEVLAGLELPCFEARGAADGPHLCLIAGIHGGEYSSIAAVVRFMNELDERALGRITAVPIVSMTSFRARVAFVVPEDGKNLNRCFPGSAGGTFSEVLAHHVFDELIAPGDVLVDLHGGDMVEALEPFTLYNESAASEGRTSLAVSFGFPTSSACGATPRRSAARPRTPRPTQAFRPSSPKPAAAGSSRRVRSGSTSTGSGARSAHLGMLPGTPPRGLGPSNWSIASSGSLGEGAGGSPSCGPATSSLGRRARRGAKPLRRRGRGGHGARGRRRPLSHLEPRR